MAAERGDEPTWRPMGWTTAASLRRWSYRRLAGAPQKTSDTNVEKITPAPYTQQTAGKV